MKLLDTKEICVAFGQFVREGREAKELYQREVAEQVSITQGYLCLIENGEREINLTLALNICQVLGLDFGSFLVAQGIKRRAVPRKTKKSSTPEE